MHDFHAPARWFIRALLGVSAVIHPSPGRAQLPTVTLSATQPRAEESAGKIANAFRVTRTGDVRVGPLDVVLRIVGNASNGIDHAALPIHVVIPRDSASVTMPLDIVQDTLPEADEQVVLLVNESTTYLAQNAPNLANQGITITDDDLRLILSPSDTLAMEPGGDQAVVVLDRAGSLSRSVTYQLAFTGSATNGTDYTTIPPTRTLNAGQRKDTIVIVARPDNIPEPTETVIVSVSSFPTFGGGHSSIGGGVTVRIVDARVTVAASPTTVTEVTGNVGSFVLTRTGDLSTSQIVGYSLSGTATNGVDYNAVPSSGSITFAPNAPTASLPITIQGDQTTDGSETIVLTVAGGSVLAAGTPNASTMVIDESGANVVVAVTVQVFALSEGIINVSTLAGGNPGTGIVTINGPAPAEGRVIALSTTLPSVELSPTMRILPGRTSGAFNVLTHPVASTEVGQIAAVAPAGNPVSMTLTVTSPALASLTLTRPNLTPTSSLDNFNARGAVTLGSTPPDGGVVVRLTSSAPNVASVPDSIMVTTGSSTPKNFVIGVRPVPADVAVTITASRGGVSMSQTLTVLAPVPRDQMTISPGSLVGRIDQGASMTGRVVLTGPAPTGGLPLILRERHGDPSIVFSDSLLVIPAGLPDATFVAYARPSRGERFLTITTNRGGTGPVTIEAPDATSLQLNNSSLAGGSRTTARVTLNGHAAPSFTLPVSGAPIAFPCNSSGAAIVAIPFPTDSLATTFSICSTPVTADTTVTIGAGRSPVAQPLRVTPLAPATGVTGTVPVQSPVVTSLVLSSATVTGGSNVTGTITISVQAPSNFQVPVVSTGSMAAVPTSVAFAQGQTSATFTVNTFAVTATTNVTIIAGSGANATPRQLTITP